MVAGCLRLLLPAAAAAAGAWRTRLVR
jgi:hypothetical protein